MNRRNQVSGKSYKHLLPSYKEIRQQVKCVSSEICLVYVMFEVGFSEKINSFENATNILKISSRKLVLAKNNSLKVLDTQKQSP